MGNHLTGKIGRTTKIESILGKILFLIYISDLPQGLHADIKLFADDASLFIVVDEIDESASKLSNDLIRIQDWADGSQFLTLTEQNQLKKLHSLIYRNLCQLLK